MKITELIKKLELKITETGDVEVETRNEAGEFDLVDSVYSIRYDRNGHVTYRIFIDV